MRINDSQPPKTPGNDKPARIAIETTSGKKQYDVEHYIKSADGWVSMYLTRDGGIDVQVPRERVIEIHRREGNHVENPVAAFIDDALTGDDDAFDRVEYDCPTPGTVEGTEVSD